ncbi:ROK family protein [Listeria costaricensis]|uniref:ROK family protein n=1 Tax=Listeria costaricensis TaxID=2026604 RepID=UPI000C07D194|nr:ROK family protein [Listeria costaricensis]
MKKYLMLDVGGTNIKTAVLSPAGTVEARKDYPAHASQTRPVLVDHFDRIIHEAKDEHPEIAGLGVAFPGPCDYEAGVPHLAKLGKYDALSGYPLKAHLEKAHQLPVRMGNDATLFGLGEAIFGEAKNYQKVMAITLGTGCGSAFIENQHPVTEPPLPENGWIYSQPFRDGIIDQYLSAGGLMNLNKDNQATTGIGLAVLAGSGDRAAQRVFQEFGEMIAEALTPFVETFEPDALIFGGQVAGSFSFFKQALVEHFPETALLKAKDTSISTMQALLHYF